MFQGYTEHVLQRTNTNMETSVMRFILVVHKPGTKQIYIALQLEDSWYVKKEEIRNLKQINKHHNKQTNKQTNKYPNIQN